MPWADLSEGFSGLKQWSDQAKIILESPAGTS